MCDRARSAAILGATDKQLARILGIGVRTLHRWKKDHPEFMDALSEGKDEADQKVIESLFRRATGYSHPDVHITNYQGVITQTAITKHYPPDTTAAIFWLKNRKPDEWRDRQEHTGAGGGPIETADVTDRVEIARRVGFALAQGLAISRAQEARP